MKQFVFEHKEKHTEVSLWARSEKDAKQTLKFKVEEPSKWVIKK